MDDYLEISTADLEIIRQLIEVTTSNGLIVPSSLSTVGALYDKIRDILSKIESDSND